MDFATIDADDNFLKMFVGRDRELSELSASVESGEDRVIFGKRGSGKTALLMKAQPALLNRYPGGTSQIRGATVLKHAEEFLEEHQEGFSERALLVLDDTDPLKPSKLKELLSSLSKLKNLQVFATASKNISLPEGYKPIFLAPIDHRKVLEARLDYLAHRRGKNDEVVENALKAIDIVASKSTSETSPREALQAVFDVMRTWESLRSTTPETLESASEAPSKSVLFAKIQNYLNSRVDYIGIAVAIGLYFLATSSDENYQEEEKKRHRELMSQIELLVKRPKQITIVYFTSARLNLRESPSTSDLVVKVLPENSQLDVLSSDRAWLYVEDLVSKQKGWVHGRYVVPVVQKASNN